MRIGFDDSIQDHHKSFYFDLSGSIFLNSFERGSPSAIKSGSILASITGSDSLLLNIVSGSFSKFVTASQHLNPGNLSNFVTGVYSASFAIWGGDTSVVNGSASIADYVRDSGSITFDTYWQSLDTTVGFYTGSLEVNAPIRYGFNEVPKDLGIKLTNLPPELAKTETVKLRAFVTDYNFEPKAKRIPFRLASTVIEKAYYRVKDVQTGKIMIPFGEANNATRLSEDNEGLYFEFDVSSLFKGRTYAFEIKIIDSGETEILKTNSVFKVV